MVEMSERGSWQDRRSFYATRKMSLGSDVHPRRKILVVVTVGGSTNSGVYSIVLDSARMTFV